VFRNIRRVLIVILLAGSSVGCGNSGLSPNEPGKLDTGPPPKETFKSEKYVIKANPPAAKQSPPITKGTP
jgi:hypothetical protein